MAILKQRLLREGVSGTFDTIHLETASGLVLRPDGTTVEDSLADLSSKKFDKIGGSISGQITITRPINNAGVIINPSTYPTDGGAACIGKSPNGGFVLTPTAKTVDPSISPVVLHGVDTPQFNNDAANKAYVDAQKSGPSLRRKGYTVDITGTLTLSANKYKLTSMTTTINGDNTFDANYLLPCGNTKGGIYQVVNNCTSFQFSCDTASFSDNASYSSFIAINAYLYASDGSSPAILFNLAYNNGKLHANRVSTLNSVVSPMFTMPGDTYTTLYFQASTVVTVLI